MLDDEAIQLKRVGTLAAHRWQGRLYADPASTSAAIGAAFRACRAGLVPFTPGPSAGFALLYASEDLTVFWWEYATLQRATCRLQGAHPPQRRHGQGAIPLLEAELIGYEAAWWRRTGPAALDAYLSAPAWEQPR